MNRNELNRLLGKREMNCQHDKHERLARALYYEREAHVRIEDIAEWHGLEPHEVDLLIAWYEMERKA